MSVVVHSQSLQAPSLLEDPSRARAAGLEGIRGQAALVRTLTDELERVVPHSRAELPISEQLIEEMTSLGQKILELASALAETRKGQCSIATPGCGESDDPGPAS